VTEDDGSVLAVAEETGLGRWADVGADHASTSPSK
jgi:hypothetical protein